MFQLLFFIYTLMTFERIKELAQYIPDKSNYYNNLTGNSIQINIVNKFIKAYSDLQFGYKFIKVLIDEKIELPLTVDEPELIDTYQFLKFNSFKDHIVHAISLTHPSVKNIEDTIKAFLISDESFEKISKFTGIEVKVLKAYEKLFFNIRDRRSEALFLANVVYPNTRLVEMEDNYSRTEDPGKILLRSGYNNGAEDIMYFSGLKPEDFGDLSSSSELAQKLESSIMQNACILAKNSFLNTRSIGIVNAKGLLMAAKQGGQDTSKEDLEGVGCLGDAAMNELLRIKQPEMDEQIKKIQMIEEEKLKGK